VGGFVKRYRAEMASPENSRVLDVLAALSREANFSWAAIAKTSRAAIGLFSGSYCLIEGLTWYEHAPLVER